MDYLQALYLRSSGEGFDAQDQVLFSTPTLGGADHLRMGSHPRPTDSAGDSTNHSGQAHQYPAQSFPPWIWPDNDPGYSTSPSPMLSRSRTPALPSSEVALSGLDLSRGFKTDHSQDAAQYNLVNSEDAHMNLPQRQRSSQIGEAVPRTFPSDLGTRRSAATPTQSHEPHRFITGSAMSYYRDVSPPLDEHELPGGTPYGRDGLSFPSSKLEVFSPPLSCGKQQLDEDQEHPNKEGSSTLDARQSEEEGNLDQPYAKLIHKALMDAPGHRMTLQGIYDWFKENTNKAKDAGSNGWKNSIRHNLSMNQVISFSFLLLAFTKYSQAFESDKGQRQSGQPRKANNVWVLTERAIVHGVESTTRYRKAGVNKKPDKSQAPQQRRQLAGAKGGRAARSAAMLKSRQQQGSRQDAYDYQPEEGSGHLNGHGEPTTSPLPKYELPSPQNSPLHLAETARIPSLGDDPPFLQNDFLQLPSLDNSQTAFADHLGLFADAAEPASSSSYPRNVFDDLFEGLL